MYVDINVRCGIHNMNVGIKTHTRLQVCTHCACETTLCVLLHHKQVSNEYSVTLCFYSECMARIQIEVG